MLASSSIAILLSAAAVMASTHQARSHNAIAMRMNNSTVSLDKRDTYMGKEMTWYPTDTGPDACTGKNHLDSDWYVAMGYDQFGDGSGCCGRQLRINYNGKSTVATCVDECASCPQWGQIDLTKGLFEYFVGDLGIGVFYGSWSYVNGDDSGDGDETTTKKQTTSTTHKTTSTPKATSTTVKKAAAVTTTHTSSSAKPSSSKKASSSSKQASSSSKQASSSSKASSSAKPSASAVSSTSATSAIPTATEAVANVGSSADNTAGAPIAGAIGTGGESGAPSLGVNKLVAAVAVVALAAVQAL